MNGNNADLASRIVSLEQGIKEIKTSQPIGSGSNILVPVKYVNYVFDYGGVNGFSRSYVFTASDTYFPIIAPKLTATFNGSPTSVPAFTYDEYGIYYPDCYSPSNPKQAIFELTVNPGYPYTQGRYIVSGTIYANCYGMLRAFYYDNNGNLVEE